MERIEWLNKKQGQVFTHKLDKVSYALGLIGHPEKTLPIIHVAGTNGKGSTIAFLSHLLQGQGFRVGSFVSPHMVTVRDRIYLDEQPMTEAEFQLALEAVYQLEMQVMDRYEAFSYFESLFLAMLLHFQREKPDFLLVEVGIGGLSDVTNLVHPILTIITSIGLDHQELLGGTLAEIAEQKAGIIKEGVPIILGPLPEEAQLVCQRQAKRCQSPLSLYGRDFNLSGGAFYHQQQVLVTDLVLGLQGQHQLENAALALEALAFLLDNYPTGLDREAVRTSLRTTRWAGRMELVCQSPKIYLDGAHNIPGIQRLIEFIAGQDEKQVTILFSALRRKDFQEMVSLLTTSLPQADVILTSFDYDGAILEEDLPEKGTYISDYQAFLDQWAREGKGSLFITGSLYFIAEVRKRFVES